MLQIQTYTASKKMSVKTSIILNGHIYLTQNTHIYLTQNTDQCSNHLLVRISGPYDTNPCQNLFQPNE